VLFVHTCSRQNQKNTGKDTIYVRTIDAAVETTLEHLSPKAPDQGGLGDFCSPTCTAGLMQKCEPG